MPGIRSWLLTLFIALLAATAGRPQAQFKLGEMYETGRGVPQSYKEAWKWYFQAAQQNRPEAEFKLGKFCEQGLGVPENTSEAIKWYQLAIAKGDSEAEESLRALQK